MTHPTFSDSSEKPGTSALPDEYRLPLDLALKKLEAGYREPPSGRLPVWVAAACLGAGLMVAPACGGKKEKEPAPGIDTSLQKPAEMAMEPELESTDPMDPVPGQVEPTPGSMTPLPPPTRGAEKSDDPLAGTGEKVALGTNGLPMSRANLGGIYGAPAIRRNMPSIRETEAIVGQLGLRSEDVRPVIRAHRNEVLLCYQKALKENPNLVGDVRLQFMIGKDGRVGTCKVLENLSDPTVGECLCSRVKTWQFPSNDVDSSLVTYRWTFNGS